MLRKVCWFSQRGEVWLRGVEDMAVKWVFLRMVVFVSVGLCWVVRR